jgi:hypothetical protein
MPWALVTAGRATYADGVLAIWYTVLYLCSTQYGQPILENFLTHVLGKWLAARLLESRDPLI